MDGERQRAPGDRIRQYEIVSELGRGGMGIVYRARDVDLGRDVALKSPLREDPDGSGLHQRLLKEARAAARLSHPNVVQLLEVFEEDDRPWLVMQFIDGDDLRARLGNGRPLSLPLILRFGEDLCSALEAAHAQHVLHRDISPKNILIAGDDRAMVTDFGLARFIEPIEMNTGDQTVSAAQTADGQLVGTPQYMSPEQCMGRELDERSDIYALGAVLYHMTTGTAPFDGTTLPALLDAIVRQEPVAVSRFNYETPEELERIIRKAMSKSPDERYQSVKELHVDVRALRRSVDFRAYSDTHPTLGSGVLARPTARSAARRAIPWVVAAALAVVAAAVLWTQRGDRASGAVPQGTPFQVTSGREWEGEPALSPDGGRIAYVSDVSGNDDIFVTDASGGRPLQVTDNVAQDRDPAWLPDASGLLFSSDRTGARGIWRVGPFGGDETMVVADGRMPAVSPDGSTLAFARVNDSGATRVCVAPLNDPTNVTILTDDEDGEWDHEMPAWSPDGTQICYAAHQDLWIVPSAGGDARRLTTDGEFDREPTWSPDGRFVYFASGRESTLALWRVPVVGGAPQRVTLGTGPERDPHLSRSGDRLAYCTSKPIHDIVLLNRVTGTEAVVAGTRDDWMPTIDRAGSRIVFVSDRNGRLELWSSVITDGIPGTPTQLTNQSGSAAHPTLSPNGEWVAYYRTVDGRRDLWMVPAVGGEPVRLTTHAADDLHPAWSPDGTRLAFISERGGTSDIWILPVTEGGAAAAPKNLTRGSVTAVAPVWSPDGTRIAFINLIGEDVAAWIVNTNGVDAAVPTGIDDVLRVGWDPQTSDLLVSGMWGEDDPTLRRVANDTTEPESHVDFGHGGGYGYETFQLSGDSSLLVYCRSRLQGDIWRLDLSGATY